MHRLILHNDEIREADAGLLSPGQVGLLSGWGVFSTLRVSGGVLFAFERHWARMQRDAALLRVPLPESVEWLRSRLLALVEANGAQNATLRVAVVRNLGGMWAGPGIKREWDLIGLTTALKDWGTGVRLAVQPQARHAANPFAGTKILSWAMNLAWVEAANFRGFDEVVLLNERDEVSECTSANIFIARGNEVWTPPLSSGCLPGVTREILLEEIHVPGIRIGEKVLRLADLESSDEVFITSSTRDLLSVDEIEGLAISCGSAIRNALTRDFRKYVSYYVAAHRSEAELPAKTR